MPTFNDPTADAAEARQALQGLAHATLRIDDPDKLYGIVGELLGATRSLEQSLIQLGEASLIYQDRAAHDDGDLGLGAADAWAASPGSDHRAPALRRTRRTPRPRGVRSMSAGTGCTATSHGSPLTASRTSSATGGWSDEPQR